MTIFDERPWDAVWGERPLFHDAAECASVLEAFARHAVTAPQKPLLSYFDRTWTVAEVDAESDALAQEFADAGARDGQAIGLYLQNMSEFVIAAIAAWKCGAAVVPINPMYQERELGHIVRDSGLVAVVTLEELVDRVESVRGDSAIRLVISTSGTRSLADRPRPAIIPDIQAVARPGVVDYDEVLERRAGRPFAGASPSASDTAFIAYTSGTTGTPKGAMLSHGSVVFSAQTFRSMRELTADDVIFAMAPLFHVTGLICSVAISLLTSARLVLGYRFDVTTALNLIDQYRATFTVGATTIFIAFLESKVFADVDISSLTKIICGGAPIPPSVVERYESATGVYLHNGYGLTESTSPTFGTPLGSRSPVNPQSGALALGVPIPDTDCALLDDDGRAVAVGEPGEIVVRGPHVMTGYWNNPTETAVALQDGWLRTGDVATMDADGWFYLVDRKKDQINAAGFKVWPQEVEEVLYEHPAVREAGVVGVPDDYRGETVKAFVSLREGAHVSADELIAFTRERLAAYKIPRQVEFLADLPKTVTGKITRRSLRELK